MTALVILGIVALIFIVLFQIGKVTEIATGLKDESDAEERSNFNTGRWLVFFMIAFLIFCVGSAIYYKDWMLGYGPHSAASEHGQELDSLFNTTLLFTGIVFVATQIALFWFGYKYRGRRGNKASFISHNNALEIWWSVIPAIVMCGLVAKGLLAWNKTMADITEGEDYIEIEATGQQFGWLLRYPGPDGALGSRNYKLIDGVNVLGQDWMDEKNLDDIQPSEIVLPVGKKVRVRITSKDVLHNFYLPHFRVKMDAVPGIPTYFVFTPKETTEEYREKLRTSGNYDFPYDETDAESAPFWKMFEYELACSELCGKGHWSMRRVLKVVSQTEYDKWLSEQPSYYLSSIRNTDGDPHKGKLLNIEIKQRSAEFMNNFESAMAAENPEDKIVQLKYVTFQTGSATLTPESIYELTNLNNVLNDNPALRIELAGHTDNTGDAGANLELSQRRAEAVRSFLLDKGIIDARMTAQGYGQNRPIDTNDTDAGRKKNRRTEFKIIN